MKTAHLVLIVALVAIIVAAAAACVVLTKSHDYDAKLASLTDDPDGSIDEFKFSTPNGLIKVREGQSLNNPVKLVYSGDSKRWVDVELIRSDGVVSFYYKDGATYYQCKMDLDSIDVDSIKTSMASNTPSITFNANGPFSIDFTEGVAEDYDPTEEDLEEKHMFETYIGPYGNFKLPAYYSDDYFRSPSTELNMSMMTFALCLEMSSGYNCADISKRSDSVLKLLNDIGCDKVAINDTYKQKATVTSVDVAVGSKEIDGSTVIFLVLNGTHYHTEFTSNVMLGKSGDHEGFALVRDEGIRTLRSFISDNGITGDAKILVTGYSRTAAGANLIAAYLSDAIAEGKVRDRIGEIELTKEDVYGFSFETPRCGWYGAGSGLPSPTDERYSNIWYVTNPYDIVTYVPPEQYGFVRYGNEFVLPAENSSASAAMLEMVQYYVARSVAADMDMSKFNSNLRVPDMKALNEGFIPKVFTALGTREHYAVDIQDDFVILMSLVSDHGDLLTTLVKESGGAVQFMFSLILTYGNETAFKKTFGSVVERTLESYGCQEYSQNVLNALYDVANLLYDYSGGSTFALVSDKYVDSMLANANLLITPHNTAMTFGYLASYDDNYKH